MKRILLIGPPGAGKSTIGKSLAKKLGRVWIDTDQIIERESGKSITDIFVIDGEPHFRVLELSVLEKVMNSENCVISLGGGAPISEPAQKLIRDSDSQVIFLDVALSTAAPRVGFNRDRPLLLGNPRAQWQALADQRRPIYESLADLVIKVDDKSIEEVVTHIIQEIK